MKTNTKITMIVSIFELINLLRCENSWEIHEENLFFLSWPRKMMMMMHQYCSQRSWWFLLTLMRSWGRWMLTRCCLVWWGGEMRGAWSCWCWSVCSGLHCSQCTDWSCAVSSQDRVEILSESSWPGRTFPPWDQSPPRAALSTSRQGWHQSSSHQHQSSSSDTWVWRRWRVEGGEWWGEWFSWRRVLITSTQEQPGRQRVILSN